MPKKPWTQVTERKLGAGTLYELVAKDGTVVAVFPNKARLQDAIGGR